MKKTKLTILDSSGAVHDEHYTMSSNKNCMDAKTFFWVLFCMIVGWMFVVGIGVWIMVPTAEAQAIHENQALFKNSLRQECYERYGTNVGCGAPLETWLRLYDSIQACQVNHAKQCQRANDAILDVAGIDDGRDILGFCDLGVVQYIVPANIAFQDYDIGWKYLSLTVAVNAHIEAGRVTMRNYVASNAFYYWVESFHRAMLGKLPAKPLAAPSFREVN